MPTLSKPFVEHWSNRYDREITEQERADEAVVFDDIGPAVATRSYFTKVELLQVGRWKTRERSQHLLRQNSGEDVRAVTRLALEAPDNFGFRMLCLLKGVAVPTASALLTVWDPEKYTVTDIRLNNAMVALGENPGRVDDYLPYLDFCRGKASTLKVSLRDLDRALWTWEKAGQPERW